MSYVLVYHPEIQNDLKRINRDIQKRIARGIENRLVYAPEQYGAPLGRTLKGYWKLRIGDYRIVFKIVRQEIWIYGIMFRGEVYEDVYKRFDWVP